MADKQINIKDIDPKVIEEAKVRAIREGKTFAQAVRDLLAEYASNPPQPKNQPTQ